MKNQAPEENFPEEKPDSFWYRVYFAVVLTTVLVIGALWAFSYYFSK